MADLQPISAVCALLELSPPEVELLVEQGALPAPTRGGYDVVACVRAYAVHMRRQVPGQMEWSEARRLFEFEGKGIVEIARLMGCQRNTVSARVKREGWVDRRAAIAEARHAAVTEFVRRDTRAVFENLAEKHALNRDLMGLIRLQVEKMQRGEKPNVTTCRAIRALCASVKTLEAVDSSIAALRDRSWSAAPPEDDGLDLPEGVDFYALLGPKREQIQ